MNTKLLVFILLQLFVLEAFSQNTLPSCVITAPHSNAYFMQGSDIVIRVYSTDMGGTYTGGNVMKVEFFSNDQKLGEATSGKTNTYTFIWKNVPKGNFRITAKATDNINAITTSAGVLITVGTNQVNPIGLSAGKGKYLANLNGFNRTDFSSYWNGVTAENSCKWGSVEGTRNVMNWANSDKAYIYAKDSHQVFRYHVMAWGSQYPSWITTLTPADFKMEMEQYMAAVAARYPYIDQLEVLNENMNTVTWNKGEHAAGTPYFRDGLGGAGVTGYDWAIWLFEKARFYFPNSKLVINDFELESNSAGLTQALALVKVLRDRNLIDGFGTQAHHFNIDGIPAANLLTALNNMARSGVPIYVTEMDMKGKTTASEDTQLTSYSTIFPVYWEHPAVAGITLWGYVEGATWAAGTGLLNSDGTERKAMTWLKSYMNNLPTVGYPFSNYYSTTPITTEIANEYKIYQNNIIGSITIDGLQNPKNVTVYNVNGQVVLRTLCNGVLDVSGLNSGIYLLKIGAGKPIKIIKE
jgi:GH35 family endo-1,4-beta-xylanase